MNYIGTKVLYRNKEGKVKSVINETVLMVKFDKGFSQWFDVNNTKCYIIKIDRSTGIIHIEDQIAVNDDAVKLRKEALRKIVIDKKIKYLIHFTRKENLDSINKYGLLPLNILKDRNIRYVPNDRNRFDGTDAICMTITQPNWSLFQSFKQKSGGNKEWVALKLNAEKVLTNCKCKFCPVNAAKDHGKHIQQPISVIAEDFTKLFERKGTLDRYVADNCTSNQQAEVLVFDEIPSDYIEKIIVNPSYSDIISDNGIVNLKQVINSKTSLALKTEKINLKYYSDRYYPGNSVGKNHKVVKCIAFFAKVDGERILVVHGRKDSPVFPNLYDKIRKNGGYTGTVVRDNRKPRNGQLLNVNVVVFMDKSVLEGKYDTIMINNLWIDIGDYVSKLAPILI